MSDPILNQDDRNSATWKRLREHLEARLAMLRASNDADHDERKTALLRGRIKEVKDLLKLDSDMPIASDEDKLFKD